VRRRLLDDYGIYVRAAEDGVLSFGLLGADAQPATCHNVLAAVARALRG